MPGSLLDTESLKMSETWPLPFRSLESSSEKGEVREVDRQTHFPIKVITEKTGIELYRNRED